MTSTTQRDHLAAALALALVAGISTAPETTAKPRESMAEQLGIVRNLGTDDAAIRLPHGEMIHVEYIGEYFLHRGDCIILDDDGSLDCD